MQRLFANAASPFYRHAHGRVNGDNRMLGLMAHGNVIPPAGPSG